MYLSGVTNYSIHKQENNMKTYSSFIELGNSNSYTSDCCVCNSAPNPSQRSLTPEELEEFWEFKQMIEDGTLSDLVAETLEENLSKIMNSATDNLTDQVKQIVLDLLKNSRMKTK